MVIIGVTNESDYPVAFPYISLTLTSENEDAITKRNFSPNLYLTKADTQINGIQPHAESIAKLTLNVADDSVSGYKVSIFYTP